MPKIRRPIFGVFCSHAIEREGRYFCRVEIEVTEIDFKHFKSRLVTYRNLDTLRRAHVVRSGFRLGGRLCGFAVHFDLVHTMP
jgi:hypothetical protein